MPGGPCADPCRLGCLNGSTSAQECGDMVRWQRVYKYTYYRGGLAVHSQVLRGNAPFQAYCKTTACDGAGERATASACIQGLRKLCWKPCSVNKKACRGFQDRQVDRLAACAESVVVRGGGYSLWLKFDLRRRVRRDLAPERCEGVWRGVVAWFSEWRGWGYFVMQCP